MKKLLFVFLLCIFSFIGLAACDKEDNNKTSSYNEQNFVSRRARSTASVEQDSQSFPSNVSAETESSENEIYNSSKESEKDTEKTSSAAANSERGESTSGSTQSAVTNPGTTITYYYYTTEETTPDDEIFSETESQENIANDSKTESVSTDSDLEDTDSSTDSAETDSDSDSDTDIPIDVHFSEEDLGLIYGQFEILYGSDIDELIETINEQPIHIDSIPNPVNSELDIKIYSFEHFSIVAEPNQDGTKYLSVGMEVFDDSVVSKKGVYVGMTLEQAEAIYGKTTDIYDGEYHYYIDDRYVYMYVQNDIVANIGFGKDQASDLDKGE